MPCSLVAEGKDAVVVDADGAQKVASSGNFFAFLVAEELPSVEVHDSLNRGGEIHAEVKAAFDIPNIVLTVVEQELKGGVDRFVVTTAFGLVEGGVLLREARERVPDVANYYFGGLTGHGLTFRF